MSQGGNTIGAMSQGGNIIDVMSQGAINIERELRRELLPFLTFKGIELRKDDCATCEEGFQNMMQMLHYNNKNSTRKYCSTLYTRFKY